MATMLCVGSLYIFFAYHYCVFYLAFVAVMAKGTMCLLSLVCTFRYTVEINGCPPPLTDDIVMLPAAHSPATVWL